MDASATRAEQALSAWLSREPILTSGEQVMAYQLFCRRDASEGTQNGNESSGDVIDTVNLLGLEALCDGRLAFIKLTPEMLKGDQLLLLPPDRLVIELPKDIPPNPAFVKAFGELKSKGYRFALDGVVANDPRRQFADLADYIKVDIRAYPPKEAAALMAGYPKCQRVATRVETRAHFVEAGQAGFTLFQGYFFRSSGRVKARHFSQNEVSRIQLLQAISSKELDFDKIEELIKHDPSLSYRLLRYLNSPALGFWTPVTSLRHGINMLGEHEIARWVRVATALSLGQEKCSDLVLTALVRGRFCELIADKLDRPQTDLFLFGVLSIMDAILDVPMGVILESLPLGAETKSEILAAKVGREGPLTAIYRLILARELGEWEEIAPVAKKLNLSLPFVNRTYNSAMLWASAFGAKSSSSAAAE
jgi:c-di-GMP-related signal transduction protein